MGEHEVNADRRPSEALYAEINASKNSLRRKNIQALKSVCDLMEKDGVQITLAEAVRRTGPDGPKYTTVSNQGSSLGEYVRLRINEQIAMTPRGGSNVQRSVADQLRDPILQARVRDTENTARYVKRENIALRSLLKNLRPGIEIDQIIFSSQTEDVLSPPQIELEGNATSLDHPAGEAILRLLDHLIGERQYEIYRDRLAINKKIILKPEELSALRITTGMSESDWKKRYSSEF